MNNHSLILGGAKSGKSSLALALAESTGKDLVFVATAQAHDQEMVRRIERHKKERGPAWATVEEPLDLEGALSANDSGQRVILVDCLTLWLSNLMGQGGADDDAVAARTDSLAQTLEGMSATCILVGNEVGLGIVPDNPLARFFRDAAGRLHQKLAGACHRVVFVAAGLPLVMKGPGLDI